MSFFNDGGDPRKRTSNGDANRFGNLVFRYFTNNESPEGGIDRESELCYEPESCFRILDVCERREGVVVLSKPHKSKPGLGEVMEMSEPQSNGHLGRPSLFEGGLYAR
jgi:hypothetical protein